MKRAYTDRSRIEDFTRCNRLRYLRYHEAGTGLESIRKPLPLAVGGAVHSGLAHLLQAGMARIEGEWSKIAWGIIEDAAVIVALDEFAKYESALELDTTEVAAMVTSAQAHADQPSLAEQLASSLGVPLDDPSIAQLTMKSVAGLGTFDKYLAAEQRALVEAMVRAYARRRLKPLLEQFEVLEVEREGLWCLWEDSYVDTETRVPIEQQIWFMSRPDALLLERATRQLYILSFKTAASWDVRKARDAEHDMQGLSEGVEVERRLAEWWEILHGKRAIRDKLWKDLGSRTEDFLRTCEAPPRIHAIRYEYMLKGDRWKDRDLTESLGMEARSQRSHLVRGYLNPGMTKADAEWNWSWDFLKDDGSSSKLYYKNWKSAPVWEHMTIREWIDMLDDAGAVMSGDDSTAGLEPRLLGYKCAAQATGYTQDDPLAAIFVPPIVVYRNDDDLRDWIDQTEAQERRIVEGLVQIEAAGEDEGEKRHLMNVYFGKNRKACEYPSTCAMVKVCYSSEETMRRDPLASGQFVRRTPNHPVEAEG